jgi:hypothetical protein
MAMYDAHDAASWDDLQEDVKRAELEAWYRVSQARPDLASWQHVLIAGMWHWCARGDFGSHPRLSVHPTIGQVRADLGLPPGC